MTLGSQIKTTEMKSMVYSENYRSLIKTRDSAVDKIVYKECLWGYVCYAVLGPSTSL